MKNSGFFLKIINLWNDLFSLGKTTEFWKKFKKDVNFSTEKKFCNIDRRPKFFIIAPCQTNCKYASHLDIFFF